MSFEFFNRAANVSSNEWPRILLAWSVNFFLRAGFVVGWTVTVAMFINRLGIELLPYLFVLNALLIMLGSIIYSHLLQKVKRPLLMVYTVLTASLLLILSTIFIAQSDLLFFGTILIAQSVLLAQLNILITLFTEDLFSPLESERTFPLIATSETMAGIVGGLTVGLMSGFLTSYKFIYLWVLCIFLIIPTLLTSHAYGQKLPLIKIQHREQEQHDRRYPFMKKVQETCSKIRGTGFLRGIVTMVILQFMLLNLMEFQYTKAIEQAVEHKQSALELQIQEYQPATSLKVSLLEAKIVDRSEQPQAKSTQENKINHEQELTKSLALLQVMFSAGTLLVQVLLASRLIKGVGIVATLMLHPLLTFLNLIGMLFQFNFFTAAAGRSSFEITGKLFQNAYHSSYYAVSETLRDHIKEVMEGVIKPMGVILGFGIILGIQQFAHGPRETFAIQLMMIAIALAMIFRLTGLQKEYTELSHQNLADENDLATRLNAIEILSQKGHHFSKEKLTRYLQLKGEKSGIKLKVLEALKHRQDPQVIRDILACLNDEHGEVRRTAVEVLGHFANLEKPTREFLFTRYRTIRKLKKLFSTEPSIEIRTAILETLAKIDHGDLIPFLVKTLKNGDRETQRACIKACSHFHDISIAHYLHRYLIDADYTLRAETIVALWPFHELRSKLQYSLDQMKARQTQSAILGTLYVLGETQNKSEIPYLMQQLGSSDPVVRHEAAKALAKLNHRASIPYLADIISRYEHEWSHATKKFIKQLDETMVESIENLVHLKISGNIHNLLKNKNITTLQELDRETLEKLKNAYATVDEHEEVMKIEKILNPLPHALAA